MTYRCALITGASSGIGEAFARALPRSTSLLLTGRDRTKLAHLASDLANAERTVRSIAADLATAEGRQGDRRHPHRTVGGNAEGIER